MCFIKEMLTYVQACVMWECVAGKPDVNHQLQHISSTCTYNIQLSARIIHGQ